MRTQEQINREIIAELEEVRQENSTIAKKVVLVCTLFFVACMELAITFSKTWDKPEEAAKVVENHSETIYESLFEDEIIVHLQS